MNRTLDDRFRGSYSTPAVDPIAVRRVFLIDRPICSESRHRAASDYREEISEAAARRDATTVGVTSRPNDCWLLARTGVQDFVGRADGDEVSRSMDAAHTQGCSVSAPHSTRGPCRILDLKLDLGCRTTVSGTASPHAAVELRPPSKRSLLALGFQVSPSAPAAA